MNDVWNRLDRAKLDTKHQRNMHEDEIERKAEKLRQLKYENKDLSNKLIIQKQNLEDIKTNWTNYLPKVKLEKTNS